MNRNQSTLRVFVSLAAVVALASCSGNTDGGSAADKHPETQFVATDGTVGTIQLIIEEPTLDVGNTGGFAVLVKDSLGNGVPHIQVACDTEEGLALTEPTSGLEHTNGNGAMSGSYGCAAAGSLQIACRVPIGANKRVFASVRCQGAVPEGFVGFPGAGGGGLGGGVSTPDDGGSTGGVGSEGVRISAINYYDLGVFSEGSASTAVDVVQGTCDSDAEPFFDTHVGVTITNSSNANITVVSLNYSVPNVSGSTDYQSGELNITGEGTIAADGGVSEFIVPVFKAGDNGTSDKSFSDASGSNEVDILTTLGLRNVTITVTAIDGNGNTFELEGSSVVSFGNFNKCS